MIFNSFEFLIFFPIVFILYFTFPLKYRWTVLLFASCFFYMYWKPEYIILLLISSLTDFFCGFFIFKNRNNKRRKKRFLFVSIIINLTILLSFKYFNFISENINWGLTYLEIQQQFPTLNLILPIGISFYTFQTMSYTIDIYKRDLLPERNFATFLLYVSFFPQLVAGPIERANRLIPQLKTPKTFDIDKFNYGLKLIVLGFFMKIVVADNLALIVNSVYSNPEYYKSWDLLLATFFFAFQIYCDFAGYTNIARGAAYIFGIELIKNFQQPYFAVSVRDFWKKWHISLSTWFRDYLYLSLGGSKVVKWKWYYNIVIVFIVSGLWHGANWTFIIWGAIHGFFYLFEHNLKRFFKKKNILIAVNKNKIILFFRIIITFSIVSFSWIFFRSENINDAIFIINNIFKINSLIPTFTFDKKLLAICFAAIFILLIIDLISTKEDFIFFVSKQKTIFRWLVYYISVLMIIGFGNWGLNEFIYFQF